MFPRIESLSYTQEYYLHTQIFHKDIVNEVFVDKISSVFIPFDRIGEQTRSTVWNINHCLL